VGKLTQRSEPPRGDAAADGPPSAAAATSLALPWGPVIRGLRWDSGDTPLLVLHEPGADLDAWGTLPAFLAARLPLDVVAWDLPSHGLSDDPWEPERLPDLVRVLADDAAATRERFVVAAGSAATAVLEVAGSLALSGVVLLSPELGISEDHLSRSPSVPKLIFAGSHAADDLGTARRLANACGGWTVVTSVATGARGTTLLAGEWAPIISDQIAVFLRDSMVGRRGPRTPR
jgi:pimeloyl-ACP methyl ester carboxylesterase